LFLAKSKARKKNFFRNIFCCFKSSDNLPNRNLKSKNANTSTRSKHTNSETIINSNQLNDINGPSLNNKNTTNLQNLAINTSNDNHSRSSKGSTFHKTSEHAEEVHVLKSNFINVDTNNNNNSYSNRNTANVQFVQNSYSNNDLNNNNQYGQSNYFSNGNDNINLNYVEKPLLGSIKPGDSGKKCLIIDLDETLVHSSFKVRCPLMT